MGRRPAVILQTASASAVLSTVLIVPLTSRQAAFRSPGTVFIDAESQNGLARASVALVFQLTAIDAQNLRTRLGSLSPDVLADIYGALEEVSRDV
ncbi:MAG: type II toxin-antitoxin system PemK/MazF family toxin [Cytophagales bacterium]|nr:type II toxin-antitoxin system PemK/MazF family toxin [Armatimonadota bacterium]